MTKGEKMMCCTACFKNPMKTLELSLCATYNLSPSNLVKHLATVHKNEDIWRQYQVDNAHANVMDGNKEEVSKTSTQKKGTTSHSTRAIPLTNVSGEYEDRA